MSLVYVGSMSLAVLVPTSFALFASLDAGIQAQLTASLAAKANLSVLPPSLEATVTLAAKILADLKAALALGLTLPSVDLSVSLEAQISILAAFVASLQALIALGAGSAGIDVFTYDGTVAGLGPALTGELATGAPSGGLPTDHADALVMMTRVSSTWTAMVDFFGGL